MALPFTLPDWLPWWVPLAVLLPALLYAIIFLLMPFSVFGLKSRLDAIEARLEEMHEEIRALSPHLPQARAGAYEDGPLLPDQQRARSDELRATPPIPPARPPYGGEEIPRARRAARSEPKLDWRD